MKYYTGVGSRSVPTDIARLQVKIGTVLAKSGVTLLTGGAIGSDYNFLDGAAKFNQHLTQVWRPSNPDGKLNAGKMPFGKPHIPVYYIEEEDFQKARHYLIDNKILPYFDKMDVYAQWLHARNYYQVFSTYEVAPSEFVVYYARESNGVVEGGTRTAVGIARNEDIPTYNLFIPSQRVKFMEMIKEL
ncbi:hypothetical protein KASIA_p133 [Shewanella phage vB_SspS_KASIA]|nr:hypothetical protein KASIA_p133 [Shewanella phage vB_SspS_KASIA]